MLCIIKTYIARFALVIACIFSANYAHTQCTWATIDFDDFEGAAPVPFVDAAQIYGGGTHNAGAYNGALGLWLNVQNGFPAQLELYNRPYTVCPGQSYQFTAWIGGTAGSDYLISIYDGTNVTGTPIATYNSFATWVFQTIGPIVPTTNTLTFVIRNNIAGGIGNNDFQMDDLSLQVCVPVLDTTINLCAGDAPVDLFNTLIDPDGISGTWSGPGALTNGQLGTFDPGTTAEGTYSYTELCPDKINNVTVNIINAPTVAASAAPTTICPGETSQLNAAITTPTFNCQETSTATGLDIDLTSTTINTFPCVPANSIITDMDLSATIGANCYLTGASWYLYDIYINGVLAFADQCDQAGLSLTAFLPITSVELRAKDDPGDGIQDNITLNLTLDITYSPNTNYNIIWTPNAGTLDDDTIENPLASPIANTTYTVSISDPANATCVSTDNVSIAIGNCGCPNFSGTMDLTPLNLCGSQSAVAIFNNDSVLGTGDNFIFILHDSSSTNLGTVLATSTTPNFSFASPALTYGTTYYISAITGDDDLAGGIDYADTCLSVSFGTPVVWNSLPLDLGPDTSFCPGQSLVLDASAGFDHYLWNDNSTNQTLTATTAGTYWVEASTAGTNLVANGDFSGGDTGFSTDYTLGTGGAWGPISNPGTYLITTSANLAHNNFSNCTDHTTGTGNMMVINGADVANQNVWCQTINVSANTDYEFSTWIQNYDLPNPAQLSFFINGVQIGADFSPTTAGCTWQNFFELWNSGAATTAQICIVNQSLAGGGNDFALDDISFTSLCTVSDTIIISNDPDLAIDLGPDIDTCEGNSVTIDATTTAATYVWQDASTNPTFNATASGTYWVDVTSNGCTGRDSVIVSFSNTINISDSIVNVSCFGGSDGEIHLYGDTAEITIYPEADSYTYEFGPATNYGSDPSLLVNPDWPVSGGTEENYTYLRFDLSAVPAGATLVGTSLEMTAFRGWANGGNGNCYTQFVADDSWQENTINYNNQPAASGTNIGFWWLWYNATPGIQIGTNSDPALNTQAATEFAGDQKLTLQLHSVGYETEYFSRESADQTQHPKLTIRYTIPYTYSWSGPNAFTSTSNPITGLEAGDYDVTITNPENCTLDTFYTVTEPTALTINLDSMAANCGGNDGEILATVTGGNQPYSYAWSANAAVGDTNLATNISAGIYTVTATDFNGCTISDSATITTDSAQTGIDTQTACMSYTWTNGINYTANNTTAIDTIVGGASNGCDSIVTLNLTITTAVTSTDIQTACESFTWIDGINYTTDNNTATDTLFGGSINGCDSIITLDLTILNPVNSTDTQTACETFTWIDGMTYTANNNTAIHTITGGANNGCDSIITLDLTIINPVNSTDSQTSCGSYTWLDGVTYSASNTTATHTLAGGANNGCDSIITLDLAIINPASSTDIQTTCGSLTWIDGVTYTNSNNTATHTIVGGASNGCDSIITLNLTITPPITSIDVQSACQSYTWIDGVNYTVSNTTATHTIAGGASNGCDSIITLNLTITNPGTSVDIRSACANFIWIDGNVYTISTNTATFTIPGGSYTGCDSIITLNLTIDPEIPIDLGEDHYLCDEAVTISPGSNYLTYTWSDGTTGSSLTTAVYGVYGVSITDSYGCVGYDEVAIIKDCPAHIWIPNSFSPNRDGKNDVFYATGENLENFTLKIFNRWGNLLFETNNIDNGWDGTYKGKLVASGFYVYLIDYSYWEKKNVIWKTIPGSVTILK